MTDAQGTSARPLLTETEAADYLSISPGFLRKSRMASSKKHGPSFVRVGRLIRYYQTDLDSWLDENRQSCPMPAVEG